MNRISEISFRRALRQLRYRRVRGRRNTFLDLARSDDGIDIHVDVAKSSHALVDGNKRQRRAVERLHMLGELVELAAKRRLTRRSHAT